MNDLPREVDRALKQLAVRWTDERADRVSARLRARGHRRRLGAKVAVLTAALVGVLVVGVAAAAGVHRIATLWQPVSAMSTRAPPVSLPRPREPAAPLDRESSVPPATDGPSIPPRSEGTTVAHAAHAGDPSPPPLAAATAAAWRAKAQEGDFDSAFRALKALGAAAVQDEAGDLLLAADVARLSHHPAEAIPLLERTVREHASDPRAPLAAFTLGRVLLDELGRPAEAAQAFAQAQALGAGGPLEEDALAREVEAASRASDTTRARGAAQRYLDRYPDGRRQRAVRRFGGLD